MLFLTACRNLEKQGSEEGDTEKSFTYTCPMHPQVVQNAKGTCPICGMDLVPFDKNNPDKFLTLSRRQQQLANITLLTIGSTDQASSGFTTRGQLVSDAMRSTAISSRMKGRIERLYVKEPGRLIKKGQLLFTLYSEDLLALQKEYLLTFRQSARWPEDARLAALLQASRQKLRLYDLSDTAIRNLEEKGSTDALTNYYAPYEGYLSASQVKEGDYVEEGSPLLTLERLDKLWVEADIFPTDGATLQADQIMEVRPDGSEETFHTGVEFIEPEYGASSQIRRIRGSIPNNGGTLRPGTYARITIRSASATQGIFVPTTAVVDNGQKKHVWLSGKNDRFEAKEVSTGPGSGAMIEITKGLKAGDRIAGTGAYLLYSEYVLKKGTDPI